VTVFEEHKLACNTVSMPAGGEFCTARAKKFSHEESNRLSADKLINLATSLACNSHMEIFHRFDRLTELLCGKRLHSKGGRLAAL